MPDEVQVAKIFVALPGWTLGKGLPVASTQYGEYMLAKFS